MEIGRSNNMMLGCKIHKGDGLRLPGFTIRMLPILGIRIIPVQIHAIGIATGGAVHSTVSSVIGSIRIGKRVDKDLHIVDQIGNLGIGTVI